MIIWYIGGLKLFPKSDEGQNRSGEKKASVCDGSSSSRLPWQLPDWLKDIMHPTHRDLRNKKPKMLISDSSK